MINKICILILAHTHPQQLKRLIDALSFEHFDIYVHIDKKSDLNDFLHPNAFFTKDRVSISWGGFSMVQATINLLNSARSRNKYSYYCLLSGMDYPIKSNKYIYDRFSIGAPGYIEYFNTNQISWHLRYKKYYYYENAFINRLLTSRLKKLIPNKNFPANFIPYWGSSWWTLNNDAIYYIFDIINEKKHFVNFFKYCSSPDEMFFQTILCNSSFLNQLEKTNHYIDWSNGGHHPKTLNYDEDFQKLAASDALFARKFDPNNISFFDKIDTQLRI